MTAAVERHQTSQTPYRGPSPKLKSAAFRALLVGSFVTVMFAAVSAQLVRLALKGQYAHVAAPAEPVREFFTRPDIVDRNGRLLATDVALPILFADPFHVLSVDETVEQLAVYFPELDSSRVRAALADRTRRYYPLKRAVAPALAQTIHDLGLPGIDFRDAPKRSYPVGRLAGHLLGYVNGYNHGIAGVERFVNDSPDVRKIHTAGVNGAAPVRLTIDVRAQYGLEHELRRAMTRYRAQAATGIVMDVDNGGIVAAASLPGVDPSAKRDVLDRAKRNRFAGDAFELGSVFKVFTLAMAYELQLVSPDALIDVSAPLRVGRFTITDDHPVRAKLTLDQILTRSSNIGAGVLAQIAGKDKQRAFLGRLGLLDKIEGKGLRIVAPQPPKHWGEAETVTVSYGHGIAVSPLQFTVAFASIVNGGFAVQPTVVVQQDAQQHKPRRILGAETSAALRRMLRDNVMHGTGRRADINGYRVGGKTGTADRARGGRYDGKSVISTFAAAFPIDKPRYGVVVTLFDPRPEGGRDARSAGRTAAPAAGKIIARLGPLLNMPIAR